MQVFVPYCFCLPHSHKGQALQLSEHKELQAAKAEAVAACCLPLVQAA